MQWVHAPLSHGDAAAGHVLPPALAEGDLGRHYVKSLAERTETLAEVIEHLASRDNLPAVFHCTAGKDRTGMVAALVLSLVGVPDDVIVHDYTLTDDRMALVMERIRGVGRLPRTGHAAPRARRSGGSGVDGDVPRRGARRPTATPQGWATRRGPLRRRRSRRCTRCSSPTSTDERGPPRAAVGSRASHPRRSRLVKFGSLASARIARRHALGPRTGRRRGARPSRGSPTPCASRRRRCRCVAGRQRPQGSEHRGPRVPPREGQGRHRHHGHLGHRRSRAALGHVRAARHHGAAEHRDRPVAVLARRPPPRPTTARRS